MTTRPEPWQDTPPIAQRLSQALARIGSVMRVGQWQAALAEGLNPAQLEALQLLASRPEGVRLAWLAEQLSVSAASASDTVSALKAKGLLEKARAADDGRALALRATLEGRRLAERLGGSTDLVAEGLADWPEARQSELLALLLSLIGGFIRLERFPELRACPGCRHFQPRRHSGGDTAHHCGLVDLPLPTALLRLDCPEFEAAGDHQQRRAWAALG